MTRRTDIERVSALSELERLGWKYEPAGADEVKILCPVHEDENPSVSLNTSKNLWQCHACGAKGDVVSLLAHVAGVKRDTMLVDLSSRYELEDVKQISPETVEKMHKKVWEAGPLLDALYKRGVTDDMVRRARLGYHDGRITIPVYDQHGRVVNVRRYIPGAPSDRKMMNTAGYGKVRLYQVEQLKHDKVWICGGEIKALVVGAMLEKHGIGAVSATAGEGSWDAKWNVLFKGKRVWVCMDVDQAGRNAARRICEELRGAPEEVRVVTLPLDVAKHPKGDVNDFVGEEGATAEDLIRLMDLSEPAMHVSARLADVDLGSRKTTLAHAAQPDCIGWRIELEAVASVMDATPYLLPREVDVSCTRDQPNCHLCEIHDATQDDKGFVRKEVASLSSAILEMTASGNETQVHAIRRALNIPTCRAVDFDVRSFHVVTDTRLSPKLTIGGHSDDRMQPALFVGAKPELNTPYVVKGKVYPHPRTQQTTLLLDQVEQTEDSLDTFKPSDKEVAELEVFRPEGPGDDKLREKLDALYDDVETNVTRIYGRRDTHVLVDVAYHSPLFLTFAGRRVNGWVNVLLIGDSAQGKTETTSRLMEHYGLGERVECKNASVAGLLGGLQQLGNRWFVSWGVIPTHDRRLVILEEVKGAPPEVLARLTDMRSSGIAEIPKIERRKAHARTRLIFVSNPRSPRPMASYSFGVQTIHELMGSLEDVRRFDAAIAMAAGAVDPSKLNHKTVAHRFTSALCRRLVLWSWTLQEKSVRLEPAAEKAVEQAVAALCAKYSEAMPLVDRGSMPLKIARMAAGLAARVFARTPDGGLLIEARHVRYVADLLERCYSDSAMGYADYSRAQAALDSLLDGQTVERYLRTGVRHPRDLVRGMLYRDEFLGADVQDWCEVDRDAAAGVLSFLVRHHAVRRGVRQTYSKTPEFIALLKRLESVVDEVEWADSDEM